jgi:multidrug efflux pump subunit AcrA (membrane-fusion protein)
MSFHNRDDQTKKMGPMRLIMQAVGILVLVGTVGGIVMYKNAIWNEIGKAFAFSKDEEPIPVLSLERGPLQLEVEASGEIVGLESVPVATPGTRTGALKLRWLIAEGTMAAPGEPLIRFDSTDTLLSLESQNYALNANQLQTKIDTGDQQLSERGMAIDRAVAQMDYDYTMAVLPQDPLIFSQWDIISAKLNADFAKSKIENLAARAKTQKRQNRSAQQVSAITRNHAQTEVDIIKDTLEAMEVRAPSSGFAVYRRERRQDPKIGDTCQAGQVMIDLVDLNALQARIYVLEKEAGGLAIGKPVNIKLDALPDGEFHGTVRSVSPLASTLERDSPFKYFSSDVTIHDAQPYYRLIKPGMKLQARVIMEKYDSCFMVPASVLDYDEKEYKIYVYVKKGSGWEKREVKLGLGKHGQATILSGVYDKEDIALRNPFETRQLKLPDFSKASAVNQQRRGGPGGDMMPPPPPGGTMPPPPPGSGGR